MASSAEATKYMGPVTLCATLPEDAKPGDSYLVTFAVVNSSNPTEIVSTFASAMPINVTQERTVCADWDGLDDNYMPVLAGDYAGKAIAMRSKVWPVDGKSHAITAEYVGAALPFAPTPIEVQQNLTGYNFHVIGDPVGAMMEAITVDSASDTAVFYHGYLENADNNFVVNLSAPIGWNQCTQRYNSGGAAGGNATVSTQAISTIT